MHSYFAACPEFASDDFADLHDDPFALDMDIAALCDDAAAWLTMASMCAQAMGVSLPEGIAAMLRSQTRIHTGYMPEAQRKNLAHRMYRDGVKIKPLGAERKAVA
jgi:hypothetical protein